MASTGFTEPDKIRFVASSKDRGRFAERIKSLPVPAGMRARRVTNGCLVFKLASCKDNAVYNLVYSAVAADGHYCFRTRQSKIIRNLGRVFFARGIMRRKLYVVCVKDFKYFFASVFARPRPAYGFTIRSSIFSSVKYNDLSISLSKIFCNIKNLEISGRLCYTVYIIGNYRV